MLSTNFVVALTTFGITAAISTANLHGVGQFVRDFVTSAGFGGLAALVAALVAYFGIRYQAQRQADSSSKTLRHQQLTDAAGTWWSTFQWTADRSFPADPASVPLPPSLAVDTLRELAVTASNDAQNIACGGLIDELAETVDKVESQDEPGGHEKTVHLSTVNDVGDDSKLSLALSRYAQATQGSAAESSILRRRAYEDTVRQEVFRVAKQAGLEYESSSLTGMFANPDLEHRYQADGALIVGGELGALVEVVAFERGGAQIVRRLRHLADNPVYPVLFIAPVAAPSLLISSGSDPEWVQWNPGDDPNVLRHALLDIAAKAQQQH